MKIAFPVIRRLSARKVETLTPVSVTEKDGLYTFDMGRNFTGWLEFDLRNGKAGDIVKFMTANRAGVTLEFKQESHYIHDAGGTLWSSAPLTLSREFYKAYGDKKQLEEAYQPMKKWLDSLNDSVSDEGVLTAYENASRFLGDWATPHGSEYGNKPEANLFNNCVYSVSVLQIIGSGGPLRVVPSPKRGVSLAE
jgi:hypothetical protein